MTVSSTVVVKYDKELFLDKSERVLLGDVDAYEAISGKEDRGGTKTVEREPDVVEVRETTDDEMDRIVLMDPVGERVREEEDAS